MPTFYIYIVICQLIIIALLTRWLYNRNLSIKKKLQLSSLAVSVSNGDVMQYIRETAQSLESLMANKQIEYSLHCQPTSMMGWIDTDKIDKIIINLLIDSAKHTDTGGKVVLDVSTNRRYERISIRLADTGSMFNGIGITLVRDMVHLHRGTIKHEYYEGQGNTVMIELPIKKDAYAKAEINESPTSSFIIPSNIPLQIPNPTWVSEYKEGNSALQEIMNDRTHSANQEYLQRAIQCVNDHLSDTDYSREDFAADMGSSVSTLYNKIRAITGKSVTSFCRDIRIKAACRMAREEPDLRVSDLAYRVGFKDPKYFATSFKRVTGQQPKEYLSAISQQRSADHSASAVHSQSDTP
ncbi:MAG: helix-turn-helix domain-containing protein [Prevotella sp.]|nr:helix-turn-helix domain-containing protein [Prevotella sp.]